MRNWRYCVQVQVWPTASGVGDMVFRSRRGPLHPETATWLGGEGGQGRRRRTRRGRRGRRGRRKRRRRSRTFVKIKTFLGDACRLKDNQRLVCIFESDHVWNAWISAHGGAGYHPPQGGCVVDGLSTDGCPHASTTYNLLNSPH